MERVMTVDVTDIFPGAGLAAPRSVTETDRASASSLTG
jgi:hypothetical protein